MAMGHVALWKFHPSSSYKSKGKCGVIKERAREGKYFLFDSSKSFCELNDYILWMTV